VTGLPSPGGSGRRCAMLEVLYHVTFTKKVPSILKKGLKTFQTTNWVKAGDKSRYGSGEVYAFDHLQDAQRWAGKMDWEHHRETGSGKVSVLQFIAAHADWELDEGDPLSQASAKGSWLKSRRPVPAEAILGAEPFTLETVKQLVCSW
jgi:hypothetical protein